MKKKKSRSPTNRIINSGYSNGGASLISNVLKSYMPQILSAKSDIDMNLETLRNRAADLAINSPLGAAAITTSARSTVGAGLKVFPRLNYKLLGISADEAREWSKKTASEFQLWSNTPDCDYYRRNSFGDLQYIAYSTYLTHGDSFCIFRRKSPTPRNPYTLRLQLIEANRVSNPQNGDVISAPLSVESVLTNGNRIINGVEVDKDGAIVAYWISNKVPNDITDIDRISEWSRIKAYGEQSGMPNILQIANDTRCSQYRGVPYLAPVIETLKQVTRYTNAELMAAIIKSFFTIFFIGTPTNINKFENMLPSTFEEEENDPAEPVVNPADYKLGPGTVGALPPGVDVKAIDAGRSLSTFDLFITHLSKQMGAALGLPYEVLMKTFQSSYSASRAALLQAYDEFRLRRTWFIRDFCKPVYNAFLFEAVAIGRIEAKGFFDDPLKQMLWSDAEFFGPTTSLLDPVKEAQGAAKRLELGLTTHEQEAMEMNGSDYIENLEILSRERQLIKELTPLNEENANVE
ncbi:MAG: phage portal protein [Selenomonadaceae bacterium]|nr:phage portal protein [Selenomonadaceae bacterium]